MNRTFFSLVPVAPPFAPHNEHDMPVSDSKRLKIPALASASRTYHDCAILFSVYINSQTPLA